jgi:hypothetical protein
MPTKLQEIRMTHERDAAWLIALYKAIHWGDPAPEPGLSLAHEQQAGLALRAIAALSESLDGKTRGAVLHVVAAAQKSFPTKVVDAEVAGERLAKMGVHIEEHAAEHCQGVAAAEVVQAPRRYCVRFHGQVVCIDLPNPVPHPIA